ncbi:TIGR03083 family protein [Friedmanniella luteola]|uniref:TIGR03083 family protein n=1 Tax=Friedmanniella luteola TaxID=546871 RepID=A0A1H1T7T7_9ACTN|nr:maleylpyruvate isomerase family mycothiol-dependent enzyme [Friedmanniella luteola]SDS56231.1 TIGR03083 family protein [Friedmanniella luteola]
MDVLGVLGQEAAEVERLVHAADLAAPVASCPGWTVHDLVTHLGAVHRWAAAATRTPSDGPAPADPREPHGLDGPALARWYAAGAADLVEALSVDVDRSCWTLARPSTVGFWRRRQLHETVLHRWDLQTALGRPARMDAEVALDGIDEVLTVMLPRQVRLGRVEESSSWVRLRVDGQDRVLASSPHRDSEPVAGVVGDGPTVLLLLWGRLGLDRVVVDGDRGRLEEVLRGALTP